tara:strand:+ start:465 stop:1631 length:1167 start_codon:yes stop_codon:yes gene_type:complete
MKKKNYIITTAGKFHHFEVARSIERKNQLSKIISGYPWFKLKKEKLAKKFVETQGIYRILQEPFIQFSSFKKIENILTILSAKNLDKITSKIIAHNNDVDVFIGQSTCGLKSGLKMKEKNKIYICERTSTHIEYQNNILKEEYKNLGLKYHEIDNWKIEREKEEYAHSDIILVPSRFVKNTFENKYLKKIKVLEFGVNTKIFFRDYKIKKSQKYFDILYLANKSVRKGFHYVLEAFKKFTHPYKRLHIIGSNTSDKDFFQSKIDDDKMIIYGHIDHLKLNNIINICHVYILPSIEDGFATSILQVASAGCPVIVTENTGSSDFVRNSNCGYVIALRSVDEILEKLIFLQENKDVLDELSLNGQNYSKENNWEIYFDKLDKIVNEYQSN